MQPRISSSVPSQWFSSQTGAQNWNNRPSLSVYTDGVGEIFRRAQEGGTFKPRTAHYEYGIQGAVLVSAELVSAPVRLLIRTAPAAIAIDPAKDEKNRVLNLHLSYAQGPKERPQGDLNDIQNEIFEALKRARVITPTALNLLNPNDPTGPSIASNDFEDIRRAVTAFSVSLYAPGNRLSVSKKALGNALNRWIMPPKGMAPSHS